MSLTSISYATTDLSDQFPDQVLVPEGIFRDFGGKKQFYGQIETLKIFEDNGLVRQVLAENGTGKVLVIDAGGSLRCAVLGDQLAALAVQNAWQGVLVFGCIRDSAAIAQMPLGVKALGTHPLKTVKRNEGQRQIPVRFAGVTFAPQAMLYADEDGLLVAQSPLI